MAVLTYAHKVVHVTLHGQMLGGSEEWQTGFHMGSLTADAAQPSQAFADLVRTKWQAVFTNVQNAFHTSYTFTGVKCVLLETDGKYGPNQPVESFPTGTVQGAGTGQPHPPQIALVATLIGGSGKGIGGKGRMYLPGIAQQIDNTGHLDLAYTQYLANQLATFFNDLDASTDAPGHVVNASKGSAKILGTNARNVPVNGVRVGNVFDTQRRRRNQLVETYRVATVND